MILKFNKLIVFLTLIIIFSCSGLKNSKDNNLKFEELTYGIAQVSFSYKSNSDISPSGKTVGHEGFRIVKKTDTIKAEKNGVFGVEFKLKSSTNKGVKVQRVWTFPKEIVNPDGSRFNVVRREDYLNTNSWQWMGYTFEQDYEMVKGNWVLQYFYKGKEIYKKVFIVV